MHKVALFGAGKIGETITAMLSRSGRYHIKVCDLDGERARKVAHASKHAEGFQLVLEQGNTVREILKDCDAVLSALPYHCNAQVIGLAAETNIHYFDLTEDVATAKLARDVALQSTRCFMPQCGLAPGFISIAAAHLVKQFESVYSVKMRVGALPIFPSNRLKYALTWSTDGLINEYGNLCEAIVDGEQVMVLPLEGLEHFSLDGDEYEAFNTSGGLGSLSDTLLGQVQQLDYKTVRYPGHRELMSFLMRDLRFNSDRETLKKVLERSVSATAQDKCLILVEVNGYRDGRLVQETYASTVYNASIGSEHFGAIQITTASGICTPLDLVLSGKLKNRSGLVKCEEIDLMDFLNHEFGGYYRDEKALKGLGTLKTL